MPKGHQISAGPGSGTSWIERSSEARTGTMGAEPDHWPPIFFFFYLILSAVSTSTRAQVVVQTAGGQLRGTTHESWTGVQFMAFRAVRYARPPVGNLRFKGPLPVQSWEGIADATQDPPACPQIFSSEPTSEDCLFLNVYTKKLDAKNPVIVFFHPGNFLFGSARSDFLGPEYLLDRDIVLVVPQSRLGPLGYLSVRGENETVENCGLRDQVMALKWVRANIGQFGGDFNRVTIAGYGAGATAVLLHTISPLSRGLFQRGIAMSGPVLGEWAVREEVILLTEGLANVTECAHRPPGQMVACLKQLDADQIVNENIVNLSVDDDWIISFGPVVERNSGRGRYGSVISESPGEIIAQGLFTQVPLLIGHTRDEYMDNLPLIEESNEAYDKLMEMKNQTQLLSTLYSVYLGNEALRNETYGTTKYLSDKVYIYPIQKGAWLFSYFSGEPVYFYMSSIKGPGYGDTDDNDSAVFRRDDLLYLFHNPKLAPLARTTDPEANAIRTYTSIWYNFASNGDPTPDTAPRNFKWTRMTEEALGYLDIGSDLKMLPGLPHKERMNVFSEYETMLTTIK